MASDTVRPLLDVDVGVDVGASDSSGGSVLMTTAAASTAAAAATEEAAEEVASAAAASRRPPPGVVLTRPSDVRPLCFGGKCFFKINSFVLLFRGNGVLELIGRRVNRKLGKTR